MFILLTVEDPIFKKMKDFHNPAILEQKLPVRYIVGIGWTPYCPGDPNKYTYKVKEDNGYFLLCRSKPNGSDEYSLIHCKPAKSGTRNHLRLRHQIDNKSFLNMCTTEEEVMVEGHG